MKIDLAGKIALVTECADAIGAATCEQLAHSGAQVVALTRFADKVGEVSDRFTSQQVTVDVRYTDVSDFESCQTTITDIEQQFGDIDILVNNTEQKNISGFNSMSLEQWKETMQFSINPAFNLCRRVSERMSERGFGRIINISSVFARKGESGNSAYAGAKAALHGFTMALAQEVARKGVTVNTVSPGQIQDETTAAQDKDLLAGVPAARLGEPSEVASLVDFLCSSQASFITGNDIAVNGGQYIH